MKPTELLTMALVSLVVFVVANYFIKDTLDGFFVPKPK